MDSRLFSSSGGKFLNEIQNRRYEDVSVFQEVKKMFFMTCQVLFYNGFMRQIIKQLQNLQDISKS